MPFISGVTLPDNVVLRDAIVTEVHARHLMCIVSEIDPAFARLMKANIPGPATRSTDSTLSVIVSYGSGIREDAMRKHVGQVVDLDCRVAVTIDQKSYTRKARLYVRAVFTTARLSSSEPFDGRYDDAQKHKLVTNIRPPPVAFLSLQPSDT